MQPERHLAGRRSQGRARQRGRTRLLGRHHQVPRAILLNLGDASAGIVDRHGRQDAPGMAWCWSGIW